jgi:hypothetical protein
MVGVSVFDVSTVHHCPVMALGVSGESISILPIGGIEIVSNQATAPLLPNQARHPTARK